MKIRQITLDEDEQPERITADLSLREAAFLVTLIGKMNDHDMCTLMSEGYVHGNEIYSALNGGVFNRFYEDGLEGYFRA